MTAPDTSVLVAGFDPSHPFHEQAQEALGEVRRRGRLIAHTIAETFAVLTAAGPYGLPARRSSPTSIDSWIVSRSASSQPPTSGR